jgi:hypothetical protein
MTRRSAFRVTLPLVTMQPATVPRFGMLKVSRTSSLPISFSFLIGARRPAIAAFTSSSAS